MSLIDLPSELILVLSDKLKSIEIKTLLILYTSEKKQQNYLYGLISLRHKNLLRNYPYIWDFLIEYEPSWNAQFPKYPIDRRKIIDESDAHIETCLKNCDNYKLSGILLYQDNFLDLSKLFIMTMTDNLYCDIHHMTCCSFRYQTIDQIKMMIEIISLHVLWINTASSQIGILFPYLLMNQNVDNETIKTFLNMMYNHLPNLKHNIDTNPICNGQREFMLINIKRSSLNDERKEDLITYIHDL